MEEAARAALASTGGGVRVVAVCGRNEAARARLAAFGLAHSRLRVLGYTGAVERFIAAADVVATKPGGLTTSEALALGRPLILLRPIPGAEEGNTRALVGAGAALAGQDAHALHLAFSRAFGEPGLLDRLSAAALRMGRPNAAASVARAVLGGGAADEAAA